MPHPENIIPPVKGERRNPNGRPKGSKNRATELKKLVALFTNIKYPGRDKAIKGTYERAINAALISKALSGDVQAIKEINDTLYGKIPDKNELTGAGGKDLNPQITIELIDSSDKVEHEEEENSSSK